MCICCLACKGALVVKQKSGGVAYGLVGVAYGLAGVVYGLVGVAYSLVGVLVRHSPTFAFRWNIPVLRST